MTDFTVVIPARYASERLPGKVLLDIAGKPMLQRVYEQALKAKPKAVYIATDDERIVKACKSFDVNVVLTSAEHSSGTERIAEVAQQLKLDDDEIIINVQGDEPLLPPEFITQVAHNLAQHQTCQTATLAEPITHPDDIFSPDIVKVVCKANGEALYFSRAPIPWDRTYFTKQNFNDIKNTLANIPTEDLANYFRHIGLYGYRAGFLKALVKLVPTPLEQIERLEQLRILFYGHNIHVGMVAEAGFIGVDTEADLEKVRAIFKKQRA